MEHKKELEGICEEQYNKKHCIEAHKMQKEKDIWW